MNDAYFATIERILRGEFSGSLTLHCQGGTIQSIDRNETIKVHPKPQPKSSLIAKRLTSRTA